MGQVQDQGDEVLATQEDRSIPRVLWRILERHAQWTPDKPFVVSGEGSISYGEAWTAVRSIARTFLAQGVQPGDRVAMMTPPEAAFPLVYLATSMVGGIWLGINTRYTESEIRFLLEDAQPTVLVTRDSVGDRDLTALFTRLGDEYAFVSAVHVVTGAIPDSMLTASTPELDRLLDARADAVRPDDPALIVYTSGSTGQPKGAVLTGRSIVENVAVQCRRFALTPEDRILLHMPPNHVGGNVEVTVAGLYAGCTLVALGQYDPPRLAETIHRFQVTTLLQVPTLYVMLFNDPAVATEQLASLRTLVWAGSAAPRDMVEQMRRRIPEATLITGYGMTEVCGFLTYTKPGDSDEDLIETIGAIDPAFELRIVDDRRRPLPAGERGEIALRGTPVMSGYWNRPEATADVLDSEGWFYTGDIGVADSRGYVTLVGRKKDMYISGGFNVYPREIEAVLESHPGIAMACVLPEADPVFQEVGVAVVVPHTGEAVEIADLAAYCRERLANYKIPKRFVMRDSLPMLGVGKVDRVSLAQELRR